MGAPGHGRYVVYGFNTTGIFSLSVNGSCVTDGLKKVWQVDGNEMWNFYH